LPKSANKEGFTDETAHIYWKLVEGKAYALKRKPEPEIIELLEHQILLLEIVTLKSGVICRMMNDNYLFFQYKDRATLYNETFFLLINSRRENLPL
jgi:hypothetical protein